MRRFWMDALQLLNALVLIFGLACVVFGLAMWVWGPEEDRVWDWVFPAAGSVMAYVAFRVDALLRRAEQRRPEQRGFEVRLKR